MWKAHLVDHLKPAMCLDLATAKLLALSTAARYVGRFIAGKTALFRAEAKEDCFMVIW